MRSQLKFALVTVLLIATAVGVICAQKASSSAPLTLAELSFPSKLVESLQKREFSSDAQLIAAKKDVDANIERLKGQELVDYLEKLGVEANASSEDQSAFRLALFKWAHALRIATTVPAG